MDELPWQGGQFQCQGCGHKWTADVSPGTCVQCDHLYVDWLNYEEMAVRDPIDLEEYRHA